ncbi:ATP-binding protein [Streptomyces sp. NPDC056061]|uniref:ATP-binding protein n=1 Tax=Streptomyces sp. NPDC056061 TaxID=3345700 RepID=UPI0035DCB487
MRLIIHQGVQVARTPGVITERHETGDPEPADLAEMIPLEIGNLRLSNPPDWGLALGVSTAGLAARAVDGQAASGARVRAFTRTAMDQWEVATGVDTVVAVAWELVANAVQHAVHHNGPDSTDHTAWLALVHREEAVVCAVTDTSRTPPRLRPHKPMTSNGRGLHLVNRLSSDWGWSFTPSGSKTVWARVPTTW